MPPPLPTSQPTEPSSAEAASTTRMNSKGDNSDPPNDLGSHRRNRPASASAAKTSCGNRRPLSKSLRCSAINGAKACTASSRPRSRSGTPVIACGPGRAIRSSAPTAWHKSRIGQSSKFQCRRSMIPRFREVMNSFRKSCKKCSLQAMATIHEFGPYRLDAEAEMLLRESEPVALGRRAVMLLRLLVERAGTPVSKDALMQAAWPGLAIEESNLTVQIAALRRVFADVDGGATWIETLPRRGYRYIGPPVATGAEAGLPASPAPALLDKPSLAVLPLSNLSGDPAQDYFSDGITGDIIAELSRFRSLFVVARHSSFAYRGTTTEIKRVGRELGVRYVAEGSVRKIGNRVRVTVQLVDTASGYHLWTERYERKL